jgi:23S rRNA (cytosine1962-C5)-methyltransferase
MAAVTPVLVVKAGRERSLRLRHPWLFSGAIAQVEGNPGPGETVTIAAADGAFLGYAAYSPSSQIRARVWSFDREEGIDAAFFDRRIERACAARAPLLNATHTGARVVHGESDGLPGVIADRYGNVVVVQLLSAGAERWREAIGSALVAATGARAVYERSDADVRTLEGLAPRTGLVTGVLPRVVTMFEGGICYTIDVVRGQKTGFYLDQRDNRAHVRAMARDKRVLNAFCYTGGFSLAALAGGATTVLSIDSAADALATARENLSRNPALLAYRVALREGIVFASASN